MIDGSIDPDFAALERQESLKEVRPSETTAAGAEETPRTIVYRGRLSSLSPRSNQSAILHCPPPPSTSTSLDPQTSNAELSPLSHLRAARLGFAVVVVLVIYWLWIKRKRV